MAFLPDSTAQPPAASQVLPPFAATASGLQSLGSLGRLSGFARSDSVASVASQSSDAGARGSHKLSARVPPHVENRLEYLGMEKRSYVARGYRSPATSIPEPKHDNGVWPLGAGPPPEMSEKQSRFEAALAARTLGVGLHSGSHANPRQALNEGSSQKKLGKRTAAWSRTATAPARELLPYGGFERASSFSSVATASPANHAAEDEWPSDNALQPVQLTHAGGRNAVLEMAFAEEEEYGVPPLSPISSNSEGEASPSTSPEESLPSSFVHKPSPLGGLGASAALQGRKSGLGTRTNGLNRAAAQTMPVQKSEPWTQWNFSEAARNDTGF
ncbi:hypothetical protein CBOM_04367 [Ceraceosorus bombacis]|uniref:Uncharacterized protein n=1 Tax=Ceraceosorus bombacis TaxID=401625 RepID=A0A0P1BIW1_9BASI|nr:hypothetical protein CBOM_04367 [Ceraceosorus bombacis]